MKVTLYTFHFSIARSLKFSVLSYSLVMLQSWGVSHRGSLAVLGLHTALDCHIELSVNLLSLSLCRLLPALLWWYSSRWLLLFFLHCLPLSSTHCSLYTVRVSHTHAHTHTLTHTLTHTHTLMHARTHTHSHTITHTVTHTYIHTHSCTHTRTHTHTHSHTITHTHKCSDYSEQKLVEI